MPDRLGQKRIRVARRRRPRAAPAPLRHGPLPGLIGYQLRLAQLAVFSDFAHSVGALGVSPGRAGILLLVEANPGVTQSRLAEAVGLDRSTMVPVLDQFEARGLVERRRGEDRRTNGLWLTRTGKTLVARMKRGIAAHENRIAERLAAHERDLLLDLLRRLGN